MDFIYYIITGGIFLISMYIQNQLKSKFNYYSSVFLKNGFSGKEIAEKMLRDNGIFDVQVISTPGHLTDHYDPTNKTVNLSEAVYSQRNAAAAAVAAHECGHAVQHATAYNWLSMRSKLVPIVNFSSQFLQWIIMAGIIVLSLSHNPIILWVGIMLFAATTLFAFITLPVEFDASNRALKWLKDKNMLTPDEYSGADDSLKWAARTYVVAAVGSLAQLIYFINIARRNR